MLRTALVRVEYNVLWRWTGREWGQEILREETKFLEGKPLLYASAYTWKVTPTVYMTFHVGVYPHGHKLKEMGMGKPKKFMCLM
jgi:hypothetical protein